MFARMLRTSTFYNGCDESSLIGAAKNKKHYKNNMLMELSTTIRTILKAATVE